MLYFLFLDDFGTLMTGKFTDKSGPLAPSVAGCRQNYRLSGIYLGSGRNRRRQVTYSHQIVRRGSEGKHPGYPFGSSVSGFPEIADGFDPAEDFRHPLAPALTDDVARMTGGATIDG